MGILTVLTVSQLGLFGGISETVKTVIEFSRER